MIETLLLVALGFATAGLLALFIAPAAWRRAVRLTTAKLEATMPISISDINADKDHIRAESAVELRRLELELEKAKERAARHLMERNMQAVETGKLTTRIAELESTLTVRSKSGLVLEQTVQKRIPDLEEQIDDLNQIVATRDKELAEQVRTFSNQSEALTLAQSIIHRQEQEIEILRSSLEAGAGGQLKHFGRAVDVDEKYSELAREKGKVDAEMSRLRQDLAQLKEIEIADAAQLRREMQHLTALMMNGSHTAPPEESIPDSAKTKAQDSDAVNVTGADAAKAEESETPPAKQEMSDPKPKRSTSWRKKKRSAKPRKSLSDRLSGLTSSTQKADA
jgi:chromosome segregation ATPase